MDIIRAVQDYDYYHEQTDGELREWHEWSVEQYKKLEEPTPTTKPLPKMMTIKELSEVTGFAYHHIRNLCLKNKIVHVKAGSKYLINYDKFLEYLGGKQ